MSDRPMPIKGSDTLISNDVVAEANSFHASQYRRTGGQLLMGAFAGKCFPMGPSLYAVPGSLTFTDGNDFHLITVSLELPPSIPCCSLTFWLFINGDVWKMENK